MAGTGHLDVPGDSPLVSVVTATWQRHELLLDRCIPAVAAQDWPAVEHVVVSDGPDARLQRLIAGQAARETRLVYAELPAHGTARHWGGPARRHGIKVARGNLIAYLDDDDSWGPSHISVLVAALRADPAAGFAFSRADAHLPDGRTARIGDGRLAHGRILTSMILHRREVLEAATWAHDDSPHEDWLLVAGWLAAGIRCVSVDAVTCDYYPAAPMAGVPVTFVPAVNA